MGKTGVYIQVPFCQTKCTYCNFHTGVVSAGRFAPYVEAVCREIREHRRLFESTPVESTKPIFQGLKPLVGGDSMSELKLRPPKEKNLRISLPSELANELTTVDTVYVGGGTPSLLEPQLLEEMLRALLETFACAFEEVTLEADPETVDAEKAAAWAAMGFNRISFGTQSFVDEELKAAGRMHRREDIYRAVRLLRAAGICNISFDLIAGLPKQTLASWPQSLAEAVTLAPEHISIYMMEIDEGSRLGLEVLQGGLRYSARDLPSEEAMAEFYEMAQAELQIAGYRQYEISNWARPGCESRHNVKYWRREAYLGFGAGAHSFAGARRWANRHDAAAYAAAIAEGKSAVATVDTVTREMALEEEFFLGLRQLGGIEIGRIEREYGVNFVEKVAQLAAAGMVERQGERLRLPAGKLSVSNEVIVELLRTVEVRV